MGRPAEKELAPSQQAPGKLHDETWAGLLRNQDLQFSQETEIMSGCVVVVACPSCPDDSPVSPGPGKVIRNMLGWPQLKTDSSGVWFFPWCPPRGESFFLPLTQQETG